ncbi:hypothetical protein ABW20_dc0105199 [Dactylellina cionopaga]|nr:hypothetical protein ABW20_dc0105199 [Dactylellina cionopaga]
MSGSVANRGLRLQVKVVSQSSHNPKGRSLAPIAEFLHLAASHISLEDLTLLITDKYARLYPRNRPLNIQRLQDSEGNDLDLTYIVGDVFDDKLSNRDGSIVKVIHKDVLRDESVPPESGLRPASSKKRPIQSLATVNETRGGEEEEEEEVEEEIGVPVNLHRSKRQKLGSVQDKHVERGDDMVMGEEEEDEEEDEEDEETDEERILPTSSNIVEPSQGRELKKSSDIYVVESSTGRSGPRSPSLGPGPLSGLMNHGNLLPPNHLVVAGTQERGSSLIPETSQGLAELLSPKEETFSSPLFTATTYRTVSSNLRPVSISPDVEDLDLPVIAPQTLKGTATRRTATPKQTAGTLKRPARTSLAKKLSPKNSNSVYELEDSDDTEEEDEEEVAKPVPKGKASRPPKKLAGIPSRRAPVRKSAGSSSTPVLEVPSSQSETSTNQHVVNDFVVEVPPIEEVMMSHERRPSVSSIQNVAELIGSKYRPEEDPVHAPSSSNNKPTKSSPPAKTSIGTDRKDSKKLETPPVKETPVAARASPVTKTVVGTIRKGSKRPETPPVKEVPSLVKSSPLLVAKRKLDVAATTARSLTPQSTTSEASDKHDGKGAAPPILQSALRSPDKRNLEAKKSVSFASEALTRATKDLAAAVQPTKKTATVKPVQEVKKPRTTFKVPLPVIPPEQQGIGDRSTVEARKAYEAFVGKPSRNRSTSSTPPVGTLTNGTSNSRVVKGKAPATAAKTARGSSIDKEEGEVSLKATLAKAGQPTGNSQRAKLQEQPSPSPVEESSSEDEVMEDAPPLSKKSNSPKLPSPSLSSESSSSESEEDSDEADDGEEEAPKKAPTTNQSQTKPLKQPSPESSESSSEDESESEKEFADLKAVLALSDSEDEDYEEGNDSKRGMTREESPVKGPAKRQLRSTSPEKTAHMRFSYNTPPTKLVVEPVGKLAPMELGNFKDTSNEEGDEDSEDEDEEDVEDVEDVSNMEGVEVANQSPSKAKIPNAEALGSKDESEREEGEEEGEELEDEDSEETAPKVLIPSSSKDMVPESPIGMPKRSSQPFEESDESEEDTSATATTTTTSSKGESDSDNGEEEESDGSESEGVDSTDRAVGALFGSSTASTKSISKIPDRNARSTPPRFSKTPEPLQSGAAVSASGGLSKLPPSRMNRRTLGYISPSPGPPSSMPARLPSMMPPREGKKRQSLNTHYQGLSVLRQQGIPETRDGRKGVLVNASKEIQTPKARMSEGRQAFENILSSQKGGKDSDDEDSDSGSDDSGSSDEDEKESGKGQAQKKSGLRTLFGFI